MLVKFEQNCMVQTTRIFVLTKKKKKKKEKKKKGGFQNHLWQSVDAILEDVSVAETIV